MATRVLEVRIIGDASQLSREFARVGTQTSVLERRFGIAGAAASRVGDQLARLGRTAAIAASVGLGAAIKTAIDYEQAFAEVEKTVDASNKQLGRISDGLRGLSKEIPESASELASLAGEAGALGVAARDIVDFTRVASQLGTTTNLASEEAATALARFANIMDTRARGAFERMASTLVDLGNKGASTEAEITEMTLRIAGAGKTVGLTEAEVLGLAAALANVGIRAEAGGSSISRVLLTMQDAIAKGGDQLNAFAEISGVTVNEFVRRFERDAPGAIAMFADGLGKISREGGSVVEALKGVGLNEIRVRDTLLRLAGNTEQFAKAQEVANKAWRQNSALANEAEKRYQTLGSQLELLRNHAQDMAIELGEEALPVLKEITQIMRDEDLPLADKVEQISDIAIDEISEVIPHVAEFGGKIALELAEGFSRAWADANPLQKALIGAGAIRLLGGRGALLSTGRNVAMWIATGAMEGVAAGAAAQGAAGAAAGAAGRASRAGDIATGAAASAAGSALVSGIPRVSGSALLGRVAPLAGRAGVVVGTILAIDQLMQELARRQALGSKDPLEALRARTPTEFLRAGRSVLTGRGFTAQLPGLGSLPVPIPGLMGPADPITRALGSLFGPDRGLSEAEKRAANLADQLERVQKGAGLSAREADRLREALAGIEGISDEAREAAKQLISLGELRGERFEREAERIRGSYERAFKLDDLVQQYRSNLRTIRANFGRNTEETRRLTRTARIAMAQHIDQLVHSGRISMREARRYLRRFGMSVKDLSPTVSRMEQDAREAFKGVGDAAERMHRRTKPYLDDLKPIFRAVDQEARKAFAGVGDSAEKAEQKARRKTRDMKEGVRAHVFAMSGLVTGELGRLNTELNRALQGMGLAPVNWGITRGGGGGGGRQRRQTGGPIYQVPGGGYGDVVDAIVPAGWYVVNRRASAALQGGGPVRVKLEPGETLWPPELAGLAAQLNSAIPRFAAGGLVRGDIAGLVPRFLAALQAMARAKGTAIYVQSGRRSRAEQAALYAAYLAGTGNLAAPPGSSRHELGLAADITPGQSVFGSIAGRFGLGFPVAGEPWHIELLGAAARGAFGPAPQEIARRILRGPAGALRDVGQATLDRAVRGARRYLARQYGRMGGSLPAGGDFDGRGRFISTSYGPPWGGIQGTGITATGVDLRSAPQIYGIAVDPSVIPLGSRVRVWPNPFGYRGRFVAFDTGGAIKGKRIDFYDWRGRGAQLRWGTRPVTVSAQRGGQLGQRLRELRLPTGRPEPPIHVNVHMTVVAEHDAIDPSRIVPQIEEVVVARVRDARQHARMGGDG